MSVFLENPQTKSPRNKRNYVRVLGISLGVLIVVTTCAIIGRLLLPPPVVISVSPLNIDFGVVQGSQSQKLAVKLDVKNESARRATLVKPEVTCSCLRLTSDVDGQVLNPGQSTSLEGEFGLNGVFGPLESNLVIGVIGGNSVSATVKAFSISDPRVLSNGASFAGNPNREPSVELALLDFGEVTSNSSAEMLRAPEAQIPGFNVIAVDTEKLETHNVGQREFASVRHVVSLKADHVLPVGRHRHSGAFNVRTSIQVPVYFDVLVYPPIQLPDRVVIRAAAGSSKASTSIPIRFNEAVPISSIAVTSLAQWLTIKINQKDSKLDFVADCLGNGQTQETDVSVAIGDEAVHSIRVVVID